MCCSSGSFLLDESLLFDDVAGAEKKEAFAGQTVASGPARFLVISLDVFGQIVMDDEADVRFVDAHAKGNGGANHTDFVAQEKFLVSLRSPAVARRDRDGQKRRSASVALVTLSVPLRLWQ